MQGVESGHLPFPSMLGLTAACLAVPVLQTYHATDPLRQGRRVEARLLTPSTPMSEPGGLVAFAHGFGLAANDYSWLAAGLVQHGFTTVLPVTPGAPSTKQLALDQRFLLTHLVSESARNRSSPVFGKLANATALAGHSLGGGSTLLAADPILGAGYPDPTAIFTLSLGTYTVPSALRSAPSTPAHVPALLFTASEDCIDPPTKNSLPVYDALEAGCKRVVSVIGGAHCEYADWPSVRVAGCRATEALCGARPNITREEQATRTLEVLVPYLNAALNRNGGTWTVYEDAVSRAVAAGRLAMLAGGSGASCADEHMDTVVDKRARRTHHPAPDDEFDPIELEMPKHVITDDEFATTCQMALAPPQLAPQVSIRTIQANGTTFLSVKPHIEPNAQHTLANITVLMHVEATAPFNYSVGLKLKSTEAIREALGEDRAAASDTPSCASLHELSLRKALTMMADTAARDAYLRGQTMQLRFATDSIWHTGMWVPFAKIAVEPLDSELQLTAPRFSTSTQLPGDLAGDFYCRLIPPRAIAEWIIANYHSNPNISGI